MTSAPFWHQTAEEKIFVMDLQTCAIFQTHNVPLNNKLQYGLET